MIRKYLASRLGRLFGDQDM